jgi:RNA polymerase sigma-32 factor
MRATLPVAVPVPMAAGSIESYIQTVNRFPILSVEEEQALARRYRQHDDLAAARGLVLSHLRLVVAVARGYLGYGLPHADLIQEGNVGLMKAVKRFEIHEYILRNWRLVKVATTKAQRKLFFNLRSMRPGLAPLTRDDVKRVAAELRVKPEEVLEMETRLGGQDIAFEAEDDEDAYAPAQFLADPQPEPSQLLEHDESERLQADGLKRALAALDPRSRRIIETRWLREKGGATLHDLAQEYKVSAERIRQIEAKALEKMRKEMEKHGAALALPAPA